MNFTQSFRLAIKSLTTSKMRALLTMLGIIIGVGAVIVILSLGNGLTGMVQQQVDKLGINMIQLIHLLLDHAGEAVAQGQDHDHRPHADDDT